MSLQINAEPDGPTFTLAELRALVAEADRRGWPDAAPVIGRAALTGRDGRPSATQSLPIRLVRLTVDSNPVRN